MGYFKVKSHLKLAELEVGHRIEESDFSTMDNGVFSQLEYIDEDSKKLEPFVVKPGLFTIIKTMTGLDLQPTAFVTNKILESLVQTKDVTDKVECFFRNFHVYKEEGIEVPKRGILLFGQAGGGKTTIINKVSTKYVEDGKTAVILWATDKFESSLIKDFIKSFEYQGVEKLILVVEDIGGIEREQTRMHSDASLLSLLDNQEKTFTIPVLILATTNYPENFMGNLTNRPDRFDDKIRVSAPNGAARVELLKFFGKTRESKEALELIKSDKCKGFTPAHMKEIVIRSRIYEKSMEAVILEMLKEVQEYNKGFAENTRSLGIGSDD